MILCNDQLPGNGARCTKRQGHAEAGDLEHSAFVTWAALPVITVSGGTGPVHPALDGDPPAVEISLPRPLETQTVERPKRRR